MYILILTFIDVGAVMPGLWGDHLGVIDLAITKEAGEWQVIDSQSQTVPVYDKETGESAVDPDPDVVNTVKDDHETALKIICTPIWKTTEGINTFFSLAHVSLAVQLVSDALTDFIGEYTQDTEYADYPVLAATAPIKAERSASNYTDIDAGDRCQVAKMIANTLELEIPKNVGEVLSV